MEELAIETKNLNFSYSSKIQTIYDLNLKVPKGCIYGFLGPNGAGKTTTIRAILGLLKSSNNSVYIFQQEIKKHKYEILKKVGALIEEPSLYSHLTAYENLNVLANYKKVPKNRIAEVLDFVNLSQEANKTTGKFSTGMKQRLALAAALLSDPDLIILDEPTNGLDPNGIIDIREMIIRLYREYNKTIFVSSHLLSEVEKIATHVGVLKHGALVFQGAIEELKQLKNSEIEIHIETDRIETASELLNKEYLTTSKDSTLAVRLNNKEEIPELIKLLVNNNINLYQIKVNEETLEDTFLNLTQK